MWCDDVCGHFANIMKRSKESQRCWFRVLMSLNQCHYCLCGNPPKMKLSSGGRDPCSTGFPYQVSVLGIHLYQCTSWYCCERLCLGSVNFFWRLFQCVCPFHDGGFTSAPAHTTLNVQQFLTKNGMRPYSPQATLLFCFPGWKKASKGNILPMWKRWNKKWQKH